MEEEMRQGMMGADVDTSPAAAQPMELRVSARLDRDWETTMSW